MRSSMPLALLAASLVRVSESYSPIETPPVWQWRSDNDTREAHYAFGRALGERFAERIRSRVEGLIEKEALRDLLNAGGGRGLLDKLVAQHKQKYALYCSEIEGMAAGSGVSEDDLFLINFDHEFTGIMKGPAHHARPGDMHCSEYGVCGDSMCASVHNEDNDVTSINNTALLNISFGTGAESTQFVAYTYLGDLPTSGWGVNSHGVGFTLNWVGPEPITYHADGFAKNFVSRDLLTARSVAGARQILSTPHLGGHNYQVFRLDEEPVASGVEVAQMGLVSWIDYPDKPTYMHTNHYVRVSTSQQDIHIDSTMRYQRLTNLTLLDGPPASPSALLSAAGDQYIKEYPVYHDSLTKPYEPADSAWTLCTVLWHLRSPVDSLKNNTIYVFVGNPKSMGNLPRCEVGVRSGAVDVSCGD